RNGSNSDVLPKPNALRRCTPAPSRVGFALTSRFTGRMDMGASLTCTEEPATDTLPRSQSLSLGEAHRAIVCDDGESRETKVPEAKARTSSAPPEGRWCVWP